MPKYVVTVRYGKEKRAELELGDSIFPYDNEVKIMRTNFKGVLILFTRLGFKDLIGILSIHPPSTVERIVPVDTCFNISSSVESEILEYVRSKNLNFSVVRVGRYGSLGKELAHSIVVSINKYRNPSSTNVLHIEPVNNEVCLGVTRKDEDKFSIIRMKKLPKV